MEYEGLSNSLEHGGRDCHIYLDWIVRDVVDMGYVAHDSTEAFGDASDGPRLRRVLFGFFPRRPSAVRGGNGSCWQNEPSALYR